MGDLICALWAKKDASDGEEKWLPLRDHLEDTGGVCGLLWDHWLCDGQRQVIAGENGEKVGRQIVTFLGYIHDLGKATPAFQIKGNPYHKSDLDIVLLENLERAGAKGMTDLYLANGRESPHNVAGEALLSFFDKRFREPEDLSSIVGGHHGRPVGDEILDGQILSYPANYFQKDLHRGNIEKLWEKKGPMPAVLWARSQRKILDWALSRAGFGTASEIPVLSVPGQVLALGLLTMADWIASNTNYFPLIRMDEKGPADSQKRLDEGFSKWFLSDGWTPRMPSDSDASFLHRFGFEPRDVQKIFTDTISGCQDPGLFILEAPMGIGKTEAALIGAEELAYLSGRRGLFFGLPTQATSNGIFPRIETWLKRIHQDSGARNGLRLIHSKAHLNEDYRKLTKASYIADDVDQYEAFVANQWFSGKKTAILDDFVVGTVDQFLMAALKQKHLALRQLAFAKKVVIIDEVHAYDAYMSQYLQMALRWMASYRVPVILLSATLSAVSRVSLVRAYLAGRGVRTKKMVIEGKSFEDYLSSSDYPLVTYTNGTEVKQVKEFARSGRTEVRIHRIEEGELCEIIDRIFVDGGNIGIIVNTVRKAQELAETLANRYGNHRVELIHSSFLATERANKEARLMQMLGKGATSERPRQMIVVGTQVIEQSLDIDFDLMISELAPVDLLIQRLGRLHRHERARPAGCAEPKLYLLGCSDTLDFASGSMAVYGGYLLARTQYFLKDRIRLPEDISPLVQAVYGEEEPEFEEECKAKYEEFQEKEGQIIQRKEERAKSYRLKAPTLSIARMRELTLHQWLDQPAGDSSEEMGNSQVRDADESIEVIALKKSDEGYSILYDDSEDKDISGEITDATVAGTVASQTLRLPHLLCLPDRIEKTIYELEEIYQEHFSEWDRSPWLKGSLGILFDQQMNCRLNGCRLHYDRKYGLTCQKEEEVGTV